MEGKSAHSYSPLLAACIFRRTPAISSLFFLPRMCVPSLRLHICTHLPRLQVHSRQLTHVLCQIVDTFGWMATSGCPVQISVFLDKPWCTYLQGTLILANLQELHHAALIWCPASNLADDSPDLQAHGFLGERKPTAAGAAVSKT